MKRISFPLQPGMQSTAVADLQDALALLVERKVFRTLNAPSRPTADEIEGLNRKLAEERTRSGFGEATRELVRYLQIQENLGDQLAGIVEGKTAAAINQILTNAGVLEPEPASIVIGRVFCNERAGVGGLRVQVVDRNVGEDVPLGEAVTDDVGNFTVSYSKEKLIERGKAAPDIQARVTNEQKVIAVSDVRYNASGSERLDVLLPVTASSALRTEHATLTDAIARHYAGSLADLQESADPTGPTDISYLANKTGWDARAVALAALADQFSARSADASGAAPAIPAPLFYALFRAGAAADEAVLYRTDAETLASIWTRAAEQGLIPGTLVTNLAQHIQRFQTLAAQKLLTATASVGLSSLREMLAVSGLTPPQQQQFATLYTANRSDLDAFWKAAQDATSAELVSRLQLDGKLALLTLNNAPLMQAVRGPEGVRGIKDPVELAQAGFHRPAKWEALVGASAPVPAEIPGGNPEEKRANYAAYLAAQVRLSYPTAAVAEMVKSGDLVLDARDEVHAFLTAEQGRFDIGMHPVEQYVARNQLQVPAKTLADLKRLQRVYQITPSDKAMTGLLKRGIDSAYQVVRVDRENFVRNFSSELGGAQHAALVYDKAKQAHHLTLSIATGYVAARNGIPLGASPISPVIRPAPSVDAHGGIAYPTLENLFGSMDFCDCEHCRSVLSPAAYLVDLLQFLDCEPTAVEAASGKVNPQTVLLGRRPDIQHLPLTCENTNTPLPYIDLVNETLEYFVANDVKKLSLEDYEGHDTSEVAAEDLLARPQYAMDAAYAILRAESFPPPLPFHEPLEHLRCLFDKLGVPLSQAMERLRVTDDLERATHPYGWRDILMEDLRLSREEHAILTDSAASTLARIYGFPAGTTDEQAIAELSNAKRFTRRVGVSYNELIALLRTRFINPNSDLVPKLVRLRVSFAQIEALHDGTVDHLPLPKGPGAPDPAQYGGDIEAWLKDAGNFKRIMSIITLVDPSGADGCDFETLGLRFSKPMSGPADTSTRLRAVEFVRLQRFIRLWRKTGWSVEQTDAAICALFRVDLAAVAPDDIDTVAKLDAGFLSLLPRVAIARRVLNALNLSADHGLLPLLACWSDIDVHGAQALYRQMFLSSAVLSLDNVFADDGYGNFLSDPSTRLLDHGDALRAAFNLTADELARIVAALGFDADTPLTLDLVSAIHRRGWLARALRLSVQELLLLTSLTGLDPFASPEPARPAIMRLIELVKALKDRSLKSSAALYLIWNQDLSGKSAPDPKRVLELARTLRNDFVVIDDQFAVIEDPEGDIARARMAVVYGQEASESFFSLLEDNVALDVSYTHGATVLEGAITAADAAISYDAFAHRLLYVRRLTTMARDALKAVGGVSAAFKAAVDELYARSEDLTESLFTRYPELKPLYETYLASSDPVEEKRQALLKAFRPELADRRKRQQALERLSAAANVSLDFALQSLDPPSGPYAMNAAGHADRPALDDVVALGAQGLSASIFFRNTATGTMDVAVPAVANLDYTAVGPNRLPANPTPNAAISGIWGGRVEAPEPGYYNFAIEADAGANVSFTLDGQAQPLAQNGKVWRNTNPMQLKAGTLYDISLTVERTRDVLRVSWETPKRAREVIPARYLYPTMVFAAFTDGYVRFLKLASLASGLGLSIRELVHFATDADFQIDGTGWLNALAASGDPPTAAAAQLLRPMEALLRFAQMKAALSATDDQLLDVLKDPASAAASSNGALLTLTRWSRASLDELLARFGATSLDLSRFAVFSRVYEAFEVIQPLAISAESLIRATTPDPDAPVAAQLEESLRARHSADDWRDLIRSVNDMMRGLRRDALVTYILHQLRAQPATTHIDSADKLFEYFLMDVNMEPCMLTSRIRHALSCVQLFIERCLMNLEPEASLSTEASKQWKWMKRYRVWEANRKVFLWPENWLEPELRDDKSPFFREIESELLQSDLNEDAAATAFLNYLSKLEDVAKLEPVGVHYVEPTETSDEVIHVVARTAGAHRKYFHRRFEFGSWTPWDPIKLDIEDNPVIPYVWKGRLLLFWLRLIKKEPDDRKALPAHRSFGSLSTDDFAGNSNVEVGGTLCWSEYYNKKWQPARTSDIDRPTSLDTSWVNDFNRASVELRVAKEGDAIRLSVKHTPTRFWQRRSAGETGGAFQLWQFWPGSFLFYNTYSLPMRGDDDKVFTGITSDTLPPATPISLPDPAAPVPRRDFAGTSRQDFAFEYVDAARASTTRHVLNTDRPFSFVTTTHELREPWNAPIFLNDSRHVFHVTTDERPILIRDYLDYGVLGTAGVLQATALPPLVMPPAPPRKADIWDAARSLTATPSIIDAEPMRKLLSADAYIKRGLPSTLTVQFGDRVIGPSGAIYGPRTEQ